MKLYDQISGKIQNNLSYFLLLTAEKVKKFDTYKTISFIYGEKKQKMLDLRLFCYFKSLSQKLILAGLITMKVKNFHYNRVTWFSLSLVIITPEKSDYSFSHTEFGVLKVNMLQCDVSHALS